jgi:alpha-L-fucosidase 2
MNTHVLAWSTPPAVMETRFSPDGALLGDGRLGAVVGGGEGEVLLRLGSNDAWSRTRRSPVQVGQLRLRSPGAFALSHDLDAGVVTARLGGLVITLRIHEGFVLVGLENRQGGALAVAVELLPGWSMAATFPTARGRIAGWPWAERRLEHLGDGEGVVAMGVCAPGAAGPELSLPPGGSRLIAVAVRSHRDGSCPLALVQALMAGTGADELVACSACHAEHWRAFWRRGRVELPDDPVLDRFRTAALAHLGSAMRPDALAPGLYGPWVTTDDPAWHGDYHLNYNFQAPIQGLWTADRPELALAHLQALSAAVPTFRAYAAAAGLPGLFAPVSLGPEGIMPEGGVAWSQRGNALYCAIPFIRHCRATGDRAFLAATAYPFIRAVADYWEAWLQADGAGVLHVRDSTAHELPVGHPDPASQTHESLLTRDRRRLLRDDPLPDLVHLRVVFANLIAFAGELGIDAGRIPRWRDLLARLAPLPEVELPGGGRAFGLQAGIDHVFAPDHVPSHCAFPGLLIGPGSEPRRLELARNTLRAADAWRQMNAFCLVLPAAVRVGYPGAADLLREAVTAQMAPNGLVITNPRHGGIETCGTMCAVDDLLMQSQDGVIHLFPGWDRQRPASFAGLRADGAFLVSAACERGAIGEATIRSEQGRVCAVAGDQVVEDEAGTRVAIRQEGGVTSFPTLPGRTYRCWSGR